jgi:predicted aspartyl protease
MMLKPMVKILKPVTMMQVFEQANWQESSNPAMIKRSRMASKMTISVGVSKWTGQQP